MNTRNWSIRSKIFTLVAVPTAGLLALWIFATTLAVGPASSLRAARTLFDEIGRPGERLVAELQAERRISLVHLADGADPGALAQQRARTDRIVTEFRRRTAEDDVRDVASELLNMRLDQLLAALDTLSEGRDSIDRRVVDRLGAFGLYSGLIDATFHSFSAVDSLPDDELSRQARALTALSRAREMLARTDALLAGALVTGRFADGEYPRLVQLIGGQRLLYELAVAELSPADRAGYQRMTEESAFVQLASVQDQLLAGGGTGQVPVTATSWQTSYDAVARQLRDFERARADALAQRSGPVATGILVRLGLAGVFGLLAMIGSGLIALHVGRSLVHRLTGLRAAALDLAGVRLPAVVQRLRQGAEVDLAQEVPPLDYGSDEIGQLGLAFTEVQRSAVTSAISQATFRRGLSEVFLNIARRSQTLLHRQLALLDRIEQRVADPEELADLFRIDHLATRMRRHAEDLVILAGANPDRGRRDPVGMVDIIRGAISEVENYDRVDMTNVAPAATVGPAVGDVIHLVAELIENATSFSPPDARVEIAGQAVAHGYAIEVTDRGSGMTPEELAQANRRLTDPPDFDPTNSARLGLFVVAQLAARHGVKVRLRPSPYGGVTAVILIPGDLVVPEADPLALPGRPVRLPAATDRERAGDPVRQPTEGGVPAETSAAGGGASRSGHRQPAALPRRVRQATVAARQAGRSIPAEVNRPVDQPSPRSPEEARTLMSALQAGTVRGRLTAAPAQAPVTGSPGTPDDSPVALDIATVAVDTSPVTGPGAADSGREA